MIRSPAIYNFRRAELERWIDRALELLDQIDGDPDLEDNEIEFIPECAPSPARPKRRAAA
jgi:hypothetical protein